MGHESLKGETDGTSPDNETSIVQFADVCGKKVLLTGDACVGALTDAFGAARRMGLAISPLHWFQVPHLGSRRNLSSAVLDAWLGTRLQGPVQASALDAVISANTSDPDHPKKARGAGPHPSWSTRVSDQGDPPHAVHRCAPQGLERCAALAVSILSGRLTTPFANWASCHAPAAEISTVQKSRRQSAPGLARNHHYVPLWLLRQWRNESGRLWVAKRLRGPWDIRQRWVRSSFSQDGLYHFLPAAPDASPDDLVGLVDPSDVPPSAVVSLNSDKVREWNESQVRDCRLCVAGRALF